MKTNTKSEVIEFIEKNGPSSPSAIAFELQISAQMVHRHLKDLLISGKVQKRGVPPKVLYFVLEEHVQHQFPAISEENTRYIEEHYFAIKPDGEVLEGVKGFQWWALKTKQNKQFRSLASEYIAVHKRYDKKYRNELGVIDATFKIKDTFEVCSLDYLFYQGFYSLPKFGKTKTGQMVALGKSGQDVQSIRQLAEISRESILRIIKHYRIDGVIFTPHSIPRKIQFLKMFKKFLGLSVPCSSLMKVFANKQPVAQKSLSKLSDRVENANNTIFTIEENSDFKRVLVIDDAVGSGATLNAIAEKLKTQSGVKFVCGFAVTGSLKGFEVINEI